MGQGSGPSHRLAPAERLELLRGPPATPRPRFYASEDRPAPYLSCGDAVAPGRYRFPTLIYRRMTACAVSEAVPRDMRSRYTPGENLLPSPSVTTWFPAPSVPTSRATILRPLTSSNSIRAG